MINTDTQPIMNVKWHHVDQLKANNYNPNIVFGPELRLLESLLLTHNWLHPLLITKRELIVIDGFHRWMLARESKKLQEKFQGLVPCVELDITRPEAMMLTISINRAKGTHTAVKMSEIVHELVNEHGIDPQYIAEKIGATKAEVDLLYQDGVFKARNLEKWRYSNAWYPVEQKNAAKAD